MQKSQSPLTARMRGDIAVFGNTRALCMAALLAAMSLILGKFLQIPNPFQEIIRISFENLPILLSGMTMGPLVGALTGAVADLLGCALYGYPINPVITLGCATVGFVAGVVSHYLVRRPLGLQVAVSGFFAHLIGSVLIKSLGLAAWYLASYNMGLWQLILWRLLTYSIIGVTECTLLYLLLRHRGFAKFVESIKKGKGKKNSKESGNFTYEEAMTYIHSVTWKGSRLGLERITELLGKLGNPQDKLRFIHVAGTNGKGSFCAMTESVLREAGYHTGLYVSPYIKHFNERICVDGIPIGDEELAEITAIVKPFAETMQDAPTEFELITAIGFVYFLRRGCDVVVLETGLGGTLDSTNVIKNPLFTVITGIAKDHTAFLGDTIEQIAAAKAGIMKAGAPVLWGGQNTVARRVIEDRAKELGVPFYATADTPLTVREMTLSGTVADYGEWKAVHLPLLGAYQPRNLANVLAAVPLLRGAGLTVSDKAVRAGIDKVHWHGRFEKISENPLILFDGAHNPEGVAAAVDSIKTYFGGKKVLLLSGVMADKDYNGMVASLAPVVAEAFTLTPDNLRALSAAAFADAFRAGGVPATAYATVAEAVTAAVERARTTGKPLIALGSLYMYCEVSTVLEELLQ